MFKTNVGILFVVISATFLFLLNGCKNEQGMAPDETAYKIIFLHHSTGRVIWDGKPQGMRKITNLVNKYQAVPEWFENYNKTNASNYFITELNFPKAKPYGWNNNPYDYYNIWVKNQGESPYLEEPTLEMLTRDYDLVIFKHCFPVSNIAESTDSSNVDSSIKTMGNYKLQYQALKDKMLQFPGNKFLVWTAAANVESQTTPEEAQRTKEFVNWLIEDWDDDGDNIFLWDFYHLETNGELFLNPEFAVSADDSHPNGVFANKVAPLFCQRIVDVVETSGQKTRLTGETK